MTPKAGCGTCGTPLTAGFCPRCLLNAGISPDPDELSIQSGPAASYPRLGEYELLEEIGRGGMGIVYRARQVSLDRTVAVKLVPFGGLADKQSALRLRAEAVAAGSLRHPNIVTIHEVGLHNEQHFIAMDFVPGPSLARLLRDGPLPGRQAARLIRQVALAVQHAHERGIIHRDLKPSNILLDSMDDQPRITDFGLAKNLRSDTQLTLTGQTLGSPNYIPPEQIRGSEREEALSFNYEGKNPTEPGIEVPSAHASPKISFTSDVYALGATLYHALTGRPPFIGHNIAAVLHQVVQDEPLPLRRLNPSVAADLETICLKCLEKEPGHRYASAKEMADELGRFLNGEPIRARPVGRPERIWRWCRRKPVVAGLFLALNVALVLGLAGILWQWHRAVTGELNARQHQYVSDMNLVKQVWDEGNLKRAQNILRAYIPKRGDPDLRGFEWRYLWNLCKDDSLLTIPCEDDPVWILPTLHNQFVAVAGQNSIRLFDPATGAVLQKLSYPSAEVGAGEVVAALPSGNADILAAGDTTGVVGLWDLANRSWLTRFRPFTNEVGSLALSPDGTRLAIGEHWRRGRMLSLWEVPSHSNEPRLLWSRPLDQTFGILRFSPDGQTLVANGKSFTAGSIMAVAVRTGQELEPFPQASVGYLNDLAFSPDGRLLASSGIEGRINIWDFTNRAVAFYLEGNYGRVNSLAFSGDGLPLAAGCDDGTIRIWDIGTRKVRGLLRAPKDRAVRSVVFTRGSKSIVASTGDEVKIWSAEPPEEVTRLQARQEWGLAPALSPKGKWLVTVGVTNWDRLGGVGATLAKVWDLISHQERFELVFRKPEPVTSAFSPDGSLYVLGEGRSTTVHVWQTALWDTAGAPPAPLLTLTNDFEIGSIAFSPDGTIMAVAGLYFHNEASATNRLSFWQVGSWQRLNLLPGAGGGTTPRQAAATVAFSKNSQLLVVGHGDGTVRLWDFRGQRLVKELDEQKGSDVGYGVSVCFSPDGDWLASISVGGENLALYDLKKPDRPRLALLTKAHPGGGWSAAFTPDNRSLVTSGGDGLIKFWNLDTLTVALTLEHSCGPGVTVALSSNGDLLASQDALGTLKLWRAPSLREIIQRETERK